MDSVGAKNIWILPVPVDFQAELHEDHLAILDDLMVPMQRRGMKLWLYDEGGWPPAATAAASSGSTRHGSSDAGDAGRRAGRLRPGAQDCIAAFHPGGSSDGRLDLGKLGAGQPRVDNPPWSSSSASVEAARASTLDLGQVSVVAQVVLNDVPLGRRV